MPMKFPSTYNNFPLVKVTKNASLAELKILWDLSMNLFSVQLVQNLLQQSQQPQPPKPLHSSEGQEIIFVPGKLSLSEVLPPLCIWPC